MSSPVDADGSEVHFTSGLADEKGDDALTAEHRHRDGPVAEPIGDGGVAV